MFDKEWPNDLGFDVVREERTPINLPVTGNIPLYAAGTLYRNGPGARHLFDQEGNLKYEISHWFDGFGQLHKFELVPGTDGIESVRYSSRFTVDTLMNECRETGKFDGFTFAQKRDPCETLFRKVMCLFTPTPKLSLHGTNVSVTVSANTTGFPKGAVSGHKAGAYIVTRTDATEMKALDASTLEPIGIADQSFLHPLLKGPLSCTHAKTDPLTGDCFNYNLEPGREATYRIFKTSASTGETEILATIAAPDIPPAYMHSFFLSENYVVFCVWSAHLMQYGLRVLWERNVIDAIAPFSEDKTVRWFVIDRKKGKGVVAQFESPAAFVFHTINAHETPNAEGEAQIVCSMIEYGNLDVLKSFYYENLRSSSPKATPWSSEGHRYAQYTLTLPTSLHDLPSLSPSAREQKCSLPTRLSAAPTSTMTSGIGDLPVLNPAYLTKPHRYFWNSTVSSSHSFSHGIAKIDLHTKTAIHWDGPQGHTAGEAIFVANPEGKDEDDGVLLTIVLDGFEGTSYLLCLDARTLEELGRADCLGVVPFTVHGQFVGEGRDGRGLVMV